jgi:hypothetical protein
MKSYIMKLSTLSLMTSVFLCGGSMVTPIQATDKVDPIKFMQERLENLAAGHEKKTCNERHALIRKVTEESKENIPENKKSEYLRGCLTLLDIKSRLTALAKQPASQDNCRARSTLISDYAHTAADEGKQPLTQKELQEDYFKGCAELTPARPSGQTPTLPSPRRGRADAMSKHPSTDIRQSGKFVPPSESPPQRPTQPPHSSTDTTGSKSPPPRPSVPPRSSTDTKSTVEQSGWQAAQRRDRVQMGANRGASPEKTQSTADTAGSSRPPVRGLPPKPTDISKPPTDLPPPFPGDQQPHTDQHEQLPSDLHQTAPLRRSSKPLPELPPKASSQGGLPSVNPTSPVENKGETHTAVGGLLGEIQKGKQLNKVEQPAEGNKEPAKPANPLLAAIQARKDKGTEGLRKVEQPKEGEKKPTSGGNPLLDALKKQFDATHGDPHEGNETEEHNPDWD